MIITAYDAKTHPGRVRDHNEDQLLACPELGLWAVADGMGGHACGEVASEIVVTEIPRAIAAGSNLSEAVLAAHQAVIAEAARNVAAEGMGSTVVAMRFDPRGYQLCWVGDSRAYRLRDGQLELISRDHSYIEWLKDSGVDIEEARNHPQRNVITQSIGVREPEPDMLEAEVLAGDRYLLCSDGLNDELEDSEIARLLLSSDDCEQVVDALIEAALIAGGRDNISAIVIDPSVNAGATATPVADVAATATKSGGALIAPQLIPAALVLLLLLGLLGWLIVA